MNIPKECYEEFGADLDGCSTQEREGCGRCHLANNLAYSNSCLEPIRVASALRSEIMKMEYRKKNKPKDVSVLDYTIIEALNKQVPHKKLFDGVDTYKCPGCKEEVYDEEYCQYCGQRILIE